MRQSRRLYQNKVKNLISSQEYERLNSVADSLLFDGSRHFWREAKRRKGKKGALLVVNGTSSPQGIAEAFKDNISRLFNSMHGTTSGLYDRRCSLSFSCSDEQWVPFLATDMSVVLKQLHADKMDADGCLCSPAQYKGPVSLVTHLTALINAIYFTGCVPQHMHNNTVVPIIKHTHLDPTVLDNYRAITLSSLIGKLMDHPIINRYLNVFTTSNLQFAFKPGSSCNQCIFVLLKH